MDKSEIGQTDATARDAPELAHFVTVTRPTGIPPELLALGPNDLISFRDTFRPHMEGRGVFAGEYREAIEYRIARQAEGYFTLNEAAQVLADWRQGFRPAEAVRWFRDAHRAGELPIHEAGSRLRLAVGETIRDFLDLLEMTEIDEWLTQQRTGYLFPKLEPSPPAEPAPAAGAAGLPPEDAKQRRARWLDLLEAETTAGRERGALARITAIEKRTRPTADRSNIGKAIKKAREERADDRRGGEAARVLAGGR